MPKRSQFLSMLGQPGWDELELSSRLGQASATLRRAGGVLLVEIFEGGQSIVRMESSGKGARELLGNLRALDGPYVDMFGEELAWTRSVEILFDMEVSNMGLSNKGSPRDGLLPSRKLDVFGKSSREEN